MDLRLPESAAETRALKVVVSGDFVRFVLC
jgi:hypothetical protein